VTVVTTPQGAKNPAFYLALGAIFAALVCVVTISFILPIPATSGYFNLGESVIYIAALTLGPFVGSIAGAGAAIADLIGLFFPFAPGTLVIKAFEGAIVGKLHEKLQLRLNATLSASIAVIIGGLEMVAGYFIYEQLVLGYPLGLAVAEIPFNIVQMIVGLAVAVPVMHAILRVFPQLKNQTKTS
jgi:uncharacterized membrane protein